MDVKLTASKRGQFDQDRIAIHVDAQGMREAYFISPLTPKYKRTVLEDLQLFNACKLKLSVPLMLTGKSISQRISETTHYKFLLSSIPIRITINSVTNITVPLTDPRLEKVDLRHVQQTPSRLVFYYSEMPYENLRVGDVE